MTRDKLSEQFLGILEDNAGIVLKISRAFAQTSQDREDLINDIVLLFDCPCYDCIGLF